MRQLVQLFARNRATASSFKIVKGYDPDSDGDQDQPGKPDEDSGAEKAKDATIFVYGVIGSWYDEIDAKAFAAQIAALDVETIHLRINSPGGDVFEARAMKTALEQSKARVVAHVDSLAASAASFLMLAADEIEIAPGAFVMIHNPWGMAIGDASEMRATADLLDQVADVIARDYKAKTKIALKELRDMMDAETWLSADDAVEKGFCDRLMEKPAKASAAARFDLSAYKRAPDFYEASVAEDLAAKEAKAAAEAAALREGEERAAQAAFAQLATDRERLEARLRLL